MAVDTGHRMRDQFTRFDVRQLIHLLEAFNEVPVPRFLVRDVDRGVALDAGARLFGDLLALGEGLVVEHVGVATLFAKIFGKRVSGPHDLQTWIFFDPRLGDHGAGIGLCRCTWFGFAAAEAGAHLVHRATIVVILQGKILAPYRRVLRVIVQFDDAIKRIARLLLTLENVHQYRDSDDGREHGHSGDAQEKTAPPSSGLVADSFSHRFLPKGLRL
jgi:hypothetical protein